MKRKKQFNIFLLIFFTFVKSFTQEIKVNLTPRQACDVELILNKGFSPLYGFMNQSDYNGVVEKMRLTNGTIWPIPITLDINSDIAKKIKISEKIILCSNGRKVALLEVEDIWNPDKIKEAQLVYGTVSKDHPGVNYLLTQTNEYYVGGKLSKLEGPISYDFVELRKTPEELKSFFKEKKYTRIIGFQTRNPMHKAHFELTKRAAQQVKGHLLIQPVVGPTKPNDIDHFTRVKCYKKLLKYYQNNETTLSLLPLSMRMAGPREALLHAIIRKNYGCTHFIIGRDHAGPGKDSNRKDFYGPYEAQELAKKYHKEIGIEIIFMPEMVYCKNDNTYYPINNLPKNADVINISGTQLRDLLKQGKKIPYWFSFPEVIKELRKVYPTKRKQGFTLFFTGLPCAGKTTLAEAIAIKLTELQDRPITILDGDNIRKYLSSELGFSKEHRSLNVQRVGYVANEITKNGGIAICSLIAPYNSDREHNRQLIKPNGGFIEIYLSTPLEACQKRDVKGLYKLAISGKISNFTGISDPYEIPKFSELNIDTSKNSVEECLNQIINYLKKEDYIV